MSVLLDVQNLGVSFDTPSGLVRAEASNESEAVTFSIILQIPLRH